MQRKQKQRMSNICYVGTPKYRMSWLGRLFVVVLMFGGSVGEGEGERERETSGGSCESTWCGEIEIRFPFGLRGGGCSYPKFDVWCDDESRTMVSVGNAGELVVKGINYENQTIQVNDPNGCLPKRFLQNLSLKLSVPTLTFHIDRTLYTLPNLTFLTCDSNITQSYPLSPISCLANDSNDSSNDSVIAVWPRIISPALSERCRVISSALVPISDSLMWPFWPDLTSDIELTWTNPDCRLCQARGLHCGFLNLTTNQVGCLHPPHANQTSPSPSGVPTSVKYGLSIGVGVPVGILCLIGVSFFICAKVRMHGQTQRRHFRPSVDAPQPRAFKMGLDGSIIEKYPKTLLGESGRLPRPNHNICPICLSEYQPKETLRTIPECNHYFHALCIDQWLKMNATCPLCRNSPPFTSSTLSPSSSISSSSS